MQLRIRTQEVGPQNRTTADPVGFSLIVENAETGEIIPHVQKVTLEMGVEDFAVATIVVSGVQVEGVVHLERSCIDIASRFVPSRETHGAVAYDAS